MSGPASEELKPSVTSDFGPGIAPTPEGATPEEKDAYWFKNVYQGDKMPQLTLRAVLMGGILGMLMAASNLYTTLAIGWAFGVAITACVMSYVIWNGLRIISGSMLLVIFVGVGLVVNIVTFGLLGFRGYLTTQTAVGSGAGIAVLLLVMYVGLRKRLTPMSLLENNCMSSTASAAGYSTGGTIATMFGALLLLTTIPDGKTAADIKTWDVKPVWVVAAFTMCTGLMGVFLAIPMKRQMINHEQLRFPSGVAAAETMRSLFSQSAAAVRKAYVLIAGIIIGGLVGILNTGEGTLDFLDRFFTKYLHFRLPETLPAEGGFYKLFGKELQGFSLDVSVLLIAAGVITRLRVCLSMLAGSALLYFVVGPWLVGVDQATAGSGWSQVDGNWVFAAANTSAGVIRNIDLNGAGTVLKFTTWSLWGGTAVMVFASLTAVALQWRTIVRAFTGLGKEAGTVEKSQAEKDVEVPITWMIAGMIPITIAMVFVQVTAFEIKWWAGLIAVAMSFFLVLVACRATGETDTTPIGAMGKVMQLMFAVLAPGKTGANLASAGIAANSASSSADLLTDLKSGYLLGANPRRQFVAQFVGVFFGTVAIVPVWFLMVPDRAHLEKFAAPATRQWEAVARILTKGIDQLPHSAQIAILIGAAIGVGLPLIERFTPAKYRKYLPSAMGLGLSWVIPFGNAAGFAVGAVLGFLWEKLHRKSSDEYSISLASGLIAGESLIKAIIAMTATAIGLIPK